MQVNRRHSSFTLRQAPLTPSRQQPNESRAARTSSSSHLAHSGTVYAAATQVRRGTERVYAESQVWRFNLIFLRRLTYRFYSSKRTGSGCTIPHLNRQASHSRCTR
jgi:hypothetical protein